MQVMPGKRKIGLTQFQGSHEAPVRRDPGFFRFRWATYLPAGQNLLPSESGITVLWTGSDSAPVR